MKISILKLESGMKLARPVVAKNGMVILGEGTELNDAWIERIRDMGIDTVFIDGPDMQALSREDALADLDKRFASVSDKPYMNVIKKCVREHIEGLYEQD
jgi:UDP-N-acetylmuramyl pentapeptide synthase